MKGVVIFRSYLSTLAYVVGQDADHVFFTREVAARSEESDGVSSRLHLFAASILAECEKHGTTDKTPEEVHHTTRALDRNDGTAVIVAVEREAHLGYIVIHYTEQGDIVRFIAIRDHA